VVAGGAGRGDRVNPAGATWTVCVGRLVAVVGCLSLIGCSSLDRPDDAAWLPEPRDVGASMVNCDDTFFATGVAEALEANENEPTGLVHLECWRSKSAYDFDSDAETLTALMVSESGGVELDQPSRCGPNLERFDPLDDGREAIAFCMGNVEYDGQTMIAGFYSVVPADVSEQERLFGSDWNSTDTDQVIDLFASLPIEWLVVVGAPSDN